MGLAGAGWTFVKAAARRLLGGLRGDNEHVSRRTSAAHAGRGYELCAC